MRRYVSSVYTIESNERRPEEVVASLFHKKGAEASADKGSKRSKPQNKELWATFEGKDSALERLASRVGQRDGEHIAERVALADGAEALQKRVRRYFPEFTLILDFIHANEYLWDTANRLFKEQGPKRDAWVELRTLDLLCGHTEQVISDLRSLAQRPRTTKAQHEQLHTFSQLLWVCPK